MVFSTARACQKNNTGLAPHPTPTPPAPTQRCFDAATSGPNAFAFAGPAMWWGGANTVPWTPAAPHPKLTVCVGSVLRFVWPDTGEASAVVQVPGAGCPSDFDQGSNVEVAPLAKTGDVPVRFDVPGTYWFACPTHCKQGLVQEVEVVE